MTNQQIWNAFNRMQKACMAKGSIIKKSEFFAETKEEQRKYYNWMRQQVSALTAGPYWY